MHTLDYFLNIFGLHYPLSHGLWRSFEATALTKYPLQFPLLDLGCGDGFFLETLLGATPKAPQEHPQEVYGLDLAEEVCGRANARGLYKEVACADARAMPYPPATFAAVFSNSVIEHIPHVEAVLSEVARVTRAGGVFLFSAPTNRLGNYFFWKQFGEHIAMQRFAKWYNTAVNRTFVHHNLLSVDEWRAHLARHGFELVDYTPTLHTETEKMWDLFLPLSYVQRELARLLRRDTVPAAGMNRALLSYFARTLKDAEMNCREGGNCVIFARRLPSPQSI